MSKCDNNDVRESIIEQLSQAYDNMCSRIDKEIAISHHLKELDISEEDWEEIRYFGDIDGLYEDCIREGIIKPDSTV